MSLSRRNLLRAGLAGASLPLIGRADAEPASEVGNVADIINFAYGTQPGAARAELEYEDPVHF